MEAFRTALRLDPKNCQAATNLGVALEQSGRLDEARQQWTHAVDVDPTCESARRALTKPR
jgi:Flp pilus assembly protein TadD